MRRFRKQPTSHQGIVSVCLFHTSYPICIELRKLRFECKLVALELWLYVVILPRKYRHGESAFQTANGYTKATFAAQLQTSAYLSRKAQYKAPSLTIYLILTFRNVIRLIFSTTTILLVLYCLNILWPTAQLQKKVNRCHVKRLKRLLKKELFNEYFKAVGHKFAFFPWSMSAYNIRICCKHKQGD